MSNNTPHYSTLDGLRGIAALMVVMYHLFEAVAFASQKPEQDLYHGYLAVDFFFLLSGFVMSNAYDKPWKDGQLSLKSFVGKRLIRLHPMVVIGTAIGLAVYLMQGCTQWDGTEIGWQKILVASILSLLLLPCPTAIDPRGNTEAFPLNGPMWSLFFEYIGSLLYGIVLHKTSTKRLAVVVVATGILLGVNAIYNPEGYAGGWSSRPSNLVGGLLRMSFAYSMGMIVARRHRERKKRKTMPFDFVVCSIALCLLLCVPNVKEWNVVYELICVAILFPAIVWIGAASDTAGNSVCCFLGKLSYPLYAIHYPFIYLYIWWINNNQHPFGNEWWCTPIAIIICVVVLAWLVERYYERPVRRWLANIMSRKGQ